MTTRSTPMRCDVVDDSQLPIGCVVAVTVQQGQDGVGAASRSATRRLMPETSSPPAVTGIHEMPLDESLQRPSTAVRDSAGDGD